MKEFYEALGRMRIDFFDIENKFINQVDMYNPNADLQSYIRNRSLLQEPDKILELYQAKGIQYLDTSTQKINR
jgi:hypothetical protein